MHFIQEELKLRTNRYAKVPLSRLYLRFVSTMDRQPTPETFKMSHDSVPSYFLFILLGEPSYL